MTRHGVLLIMSVSGIVGVITGMVCASAYWLEFGDRFARVAAVAKTEAAIVAKVALLEHLRAGHYKDATMQLEDQLDTDLVGAGSLARNGVAFSSNAQSAMERERHARELTGYAPVNASVSAGVQEAFRLVARWEPDDIVTPP